MITLENVSVCIGDKHLLSNIAASLPPGKLSAIIGPNGAGKSTLLNAMAGGVTPTCGEVKIGTRRIDAIPTADLAKTRAVLSQNLDLSFPLRVHEVVALGRGIRIETPEYRHNIVAAALRQAAAGELHDRDFTSLSGGERQRVHFARLLAQLWERLKRKKSAILLLDEPTSAMDMRHQRALLEQLVTLAAGNVTVCCVLHDLNLAAAYADHILALKSGKLFLSGTVPNVFRPALLSALFDTPMITLPHPHRPRQIVVAQAYANQVAEWAG